MWILRWLVFILVMFFLVGFLSENADQMVNVKLLGKTFPDAPLSYALFFAGLAGYVVCLIVALINQLRLRSQISSLRRKNREQQIELDRLRNFALEGDIPGAALQHEPMDEEELP
jgi:uncharacterized integral membrane protein